jgi:hypothetical protein
MRFDCFLRFSLSISFAATLCSAASAVPYASGVRNTGGTTWEFVLNEDADSVTVLRDGANPLNLATTKGRLTFDLGAFNTFDIQVAKSAPETWTLLSDPSNLHTSFESPRGATVNKIPTSPYFGTVYVPNVNALPSAAGRQMGDGVYSLTADLLTVDLSTPNWVVPGVNDTTQAKGAAFMPNAAAANMYRVALDDAGNLLVSDFTDASGGLYWMSPAMTTGGRVLGGVNFDGSTPTQTGPNGGVYSDEIDEFGRIPLHGSFTSKVYATGSIGNNLNVYGLDEDLDAELSVPNNDKHSVWHWNVGDAAPDANGNIDYQALAPELIIDSKGIGATWLARNTFVATGAFYSPQHDKWYLTEQRFNGDEAGLVVASANEVDPHTPTIEFNSLLWSRDPNGDTNTADAIDGHTGFPTTPSGTISDIEDVFRHAGNVTMSADGTKLFLHKDGFYGANPALGNGAVVIIPLDENGVPDLVVDDMGTASTADDKITNVQTIVIAGNGQSHSAATPLDLDAAGNLYITNNAGTAAAGFVERMEVYSPGGAWKATTSGSLAAMGSTAFDLEALVDSGLMGDHNGDGSVDAADYVLWRKNPSAFGGDPGGYNAFFENFGDSNAAGGAVPEPAAAMLVAIGMLIVGGCRRRVG